MHGPADHQTTPPAAPPNRPGAQRGAVRAGERALAPDLARGVMLLLIVLSNTGFYLWAAEHGASGWHPVDGSGPDRVVQFLMIMLLDLRIYPLFAFLFGYGIMRLYLRQTAAGTSERAAVGLLSRRGLMLIAFGFLHAALLLAGDIIGSYGLTSLALVWLFVRRRNGTLLVWAAIAAGLICIPAVEALWAAATGDLASLGAPAAAPTTVVYASGEADPLVAAGTRLTTWAFVTVGGAALSFGGHAVMLLGFWAARKGVLEEPHRHLRLLGWTAGVGVAVGWLGGLPAALAHVGMLHVPAVAVSEEGALSAIQNTTGVAGGLGYVAAFGLLAYWMSARARNSVVVSAVVAAGKRSLSCYLTHSLIFSPLLAAWGLGLGAYFGSATMAMFAIAVWLVTVIGAWALERAGRPGPAEALMRRLTYGGRRTRAVGRGRDEPGVGS